MASLSFCKENLREKLKYKEQDNIASCSVVYTDRAVWDVYPEFK